MSVVQLCCGSVVSGVEVPAFRAICCSFLASNLTSDAPSSLVDLSLQRRLALKTQTSSVDVIRAEWSEQQEDPNIEKLWEEDWDDDQVTVHVVLTYTSLKSQACQYQTAVGRAHCVVQEKHRLRHDYDMTGQSGPDLSFTMCQVTDDFCNQLRAELKK
jgi:hypothetical protein